MIAGTSSDLMNVKQAASAGRPSLADIGSAGQGGLMATITIGCDPAPLQAVIDELLADLAQRPLEVVDAVLGRFQALAQPTRIESRGFPAAGAGECLVVLHASDALFGLLAAVRAGDFDV